MIFLIFFVCLIASTIGAMTGIGGGIIIKPVVDAMGVFPADTLSFLSGCTVLTMTVVSLIKGRQILSRDNLRGIIWMAAGAVIGGIGGKLIFDMINTGRNGGVPLGFVQSVLITILTIIVLFYLLNQDMFKSFQIRHPAICTLAGIVLGLLSSFLGIGGGPINLMVLYILFSMDAKKTAISSILIIFFSQTANLIYGCVMRTIPDFSPAMLCLMAAGGICGGFVGNAILRRARSDKIQHLFIWVLVLIIIISLYNTVKYLAL